MCDNYEGGSAQGLETEWVGCSFLAILLLSSLFGLMVEMLRSLQNFSVSASRKCSEKFSCWKSTAEQESSLTGLGRVLRITKVQVIKEKKN